jgi:broad specificity phosphatase PhoE
MHILFAGLLLNLAIGFAAAAQEAVYLIRHGEKELSGTDPALTPEGRLRAADWAKMLGYVGIDVIITSDALRTQETGGIVADSLGLQTSSLPRGDVAGLVDTLEFDHEDNTVLVVAHAETIPRILEYFGVLEDIDIDQDEFANLYVVLKPSSDDPKFIRMLMP